MMISFKEQLLQQRELIRQRSIEKHQENEYRRWIKGVKVHICMGNIGAFKRELERRAEFGVSTEIILRDVSRRARGSSVLHIACVNGRCDVINYLITELNCAKFIGVENHEGFTPI